MTIPEHPVDKAARILGSAAALGRLLGVSKGAVGQWKREGGRVPPEHCPTIERATRDKGDPVLCEDLCPGVDWQVLRSAPPTMLARSLVTEDQAVDLDIPVDVQEAA